METNEFKYRAKYTYLKNVDPLNKVNIGAKMRNGCFILYFPCACQVYFNSRSKPCDNKFVFTTFPPHKEKLMNSVQ